MKRKSPKMLEIEEREGATIEDMIVEMINDGAVLKEIGFRFGVSKSIIVYWIALNHITVQRVATRLDERIEIRKTSERR